MSLIYACFIQLNIFVYIEVNHHNNVVYYEMEAKLQSMFETIMSL